MRTTNTCYICGEIAGKPTQDLISLLLGEAEYVRRVLAETENFAVVPSLGPVVPGHMLLCPRLHVCGMAALPPGLEAEHEFIRRRLIGELAMAFSAPVHCFEHGGAPDANRVLCSVGHAHVHFLPADVDVRSVLLASGRWVSVRTGLQALQCAVRGREYLYYVSPHGEAQVLVPLNGEFESQYLRRVFADVLGCPEKWNWRADPRPEIVHETFSALHKRFAGAFGAVGIQNH